MNLVLEPYTRREDADPCALEIVGDWSRMYCARVYVATIRAERTCAAKVAARVMLDLMLDEERLNEVGLEFWDLYSAAIKLGLGVE